MIIGVDAGALSISDDRLKVGVYRVTKNALEAIALIDKKNNYRLYTFQAIEEGIVERFGGRVEVVQLPKLGWQRVWLPFELKKHPVDAFLGFAQALPSVSTLCDIGFIYDLGFMYRPDVYGASAATLKRQTDTLVGRADHIITISQATKADVIRRYHGLTKTVSVAYPGVDRRFSPAGEKYSGGRPYFLFVGSLTKTKDIPRLVEAFAGLNTYDLYLIGGDYWPDPEIDEAIKTFHLGDRVKKLGFVSDEELPNYYRGAVAFVTTALQEGFCIPAVEAMACGTPVVALGRGALKEVVGEGGIIISQKSDFTEAMRSMTEKKTRDGFVKKAIEQAKKFRWEQFGEEILHQIRKARPSKI
ncbi:MAG: glycosyltransferase family 1 protein [Patescibacteria group bacterium]